MARKPATDQAAKPPKVAKAPRPTAPSANAIDTGAHPLGADFLEIMRLWVDPAGAMHAFIRPRLKQPELFGRMLAQAARQGARAYAQDQALDEETALGRIWAGVDAARAPAKDGKAGQ